jgi:hypothetical protein
MPLAASTLLYFECSAKCDQDMQCMSSVLSTAQSAACDTPCVLLYRTLYGTETPAKCEGELGPTYGR